jgi:hypothetical protein
MENTIPDFLGAPLIPELGANISTGSAGYIHLILISVPAAGAFPNQLALIILDDADLSIIAAALTIIALGIQLGIHNIIIDMTKQSHHSRNIILHIRHLYITDSAAGR